MMFIFFVIDFDGINVLELEEGKFGWYNLSEVSELLMVLGDYYIIDYVVKGLGVIYGNFMYIMDFELLFYWIDFC